MNTTLKNWKKWSTLLGAVAVMGVAGCADRNGNGQPDSTATPGEVARTADKAADATSNAASGAVDAASNAATKAGTAVKGMDDAMVMTPKIKTALGANASLAGSNINVTTKDKSIMLDGTVKNAAQKNVAGSIAKQNAPGYMIMNNLKMSAAGKMPMKPGMSKMKPGMKKGN